MISRVRGTLVARDVDRIEVLTEGGVAYELLIPLSVFERLPRLGEQVELPTHLVAREDGWQLYGFQSELERRLFQKLLGATGVGPALALSLLSALASDRLVQAIRDNDIAVLQRVPRVGRKTAERLVLELRDKLDGLGAPTDGRPRPAVAGADDAVKALVSLGYSGAEADRGVRAALAAGHSGAVSELIKSALSELGRR
ncbi:MAG TPA: Holliday junction branch migration protein RuvA [Gemmatimonadaceae bacterium]|nr:Holliday junction branch migration protein RuvA [Gemmatimonadaceae bacterium]